MEENKITDTSTVIEEEVKTQETKTYTQEEVLALVQSEADKRVTAALKHNKKSTKKS